MLGQNINIINYEFRLFIKRRTSRTPGALHSGYQFTSSMIEDIISNPILDYEETEAVAHSLIKE